MKWLDASLGFFAGIAFSVLAFFAWKGMFKPKPQAVNEDYYLITNQIAKMNKMVVLEQNFSSFQTHRSSAFSIAGYDVLPKEMVLYSTAKAQVSYDLTQMQVKVDSIHKKLIIESLPKADIQIFPEAKIQFMDDYAVNRFTQQDLQKIMQSAKDNTVKSIDKKALEREGRIQLNENLNDLFVLAKALNYTVEDRTGVIEIKP